MLPHTTNLNLLKIKHHNKISIPTFHNLNHKIPEVICQIKKTQTNNLLFKVHNRQKKIHQLILLKIPSHKYNLVDKAIHNLTVNTLIVLLDILHIHKAKLLHHYNLHKTPNQKK